MENGGKLQNEYRISNLEPNRIFRDCGGGEGAYEYY